MGMAAVCERCIKSIRTDYEPDIGCGKRYRLTRFK